MPILEPLNVLLPGQGPESRDRDPVADGGLRTRAAHVVVTAVRWAI